MTGPKRTDWLMRSVTVLLVIAIITISLAIRLWIADGEPGCVFSRDPALCVAVTKIGDDRG